MVTRARRPVLVGIDSCDGADPRDSADPRGSADPRDSPDPQDGAARPDGMVAAETAATEAYRFHLPLRLVCCRYPAASSRRILDRTVERLRERFPTMVMTTAAYPAANRGALADVVVEQSRDAALVVVGPRHTGGYDNLLGRWLKHRVVTHSRCPVLVAHACAACDCADCDHGTDEHRPVLVGLDGSEHSAAAVPLAFEQAMLRGVPVRAVNVHSIDPRAASEADEGGGYTAGTAQAWSADLIAAALDGWPDRYPEVAVVSEPMYAPDVVAAFVAASASAPLVVVGCRGRTACTSLLPGSVSRALIHEARCPVLVARAHPQPTLRRTVTAGVGFATEGRRARLSAVAPPATYPPGPRHAGSHPAESHLAVGRHDQWTA
jgi:nucleotide-binding universal stress UspA family protein